MIKSSSSSSTTRFIRVEYSFKSSSICRNSCSLYFARNRLHPVGSLTALLTTVFSFRKRVTAARANGTSSFVPTNHNFLLRLSKETLKMRFSVRSCLNWLHVAVFSRWTLSSSKSTHSSTTSRLTSLEAFSAAAVFIPITVRLSFLAESKAKPACKLLAVNWSLMNARQAVLLSISKAFCDISKLISITLAIVSHTTAETLWIVYGGARIWTFPVSRCMLTWVSSYSASSSFPKSISLRNCNLTVSSISIDLVSIEDLSFTFLSMIVFNSCKSFLSPSTSWFFPVREITCCWATQCTFTFSFMALAFFIKISTTAFQASGRTCEVAVWNSCLKEAIASHASSNVFLSADILSEGLTIMLLVPSSQVVVTPWSSWTCLKSALWCSQIKRITCESTGMLATSSTSSASGWESGFPRKGLWRLTSNFASLRVWLFDKTLVTTARESELTNWWVVAICC